VTRGASDGPAAAVRPRDNVVTCRSDDRALGVAGGLAATFGVTLPHIDQRQLAERVRAGMARARSERRRPY
jgi:hypothetical protein